mmetsp:Transcript_13899/g.45365  ORF Transcript_13899/g.45365 Transcript_13899/m.45365 type:complete len:261 (+) Transcript_13899:2127-2909(+)
MPRPPAEQLRVGPPVRGLHRRRRELGRGLGDLRRRAGDLLARGVDEPQYVGLLLRQGRRRPPHGRRPRPRHRRGLLVGLRVAHVLRPAVPRRPPHHLLRLPLGLLPLLYAPLLRLRPRRRRLGRLLDAPLRRHDDPHVRQPPSALGLGPLPGPLGQRSLVRRRHRLPLRQGTRGLGEGRGPLRLLARQVRLPLLPPLRRRHRLGLLDPPLPPHHRPPPHQRHQARQEALGGERTTHRVQVSASIHRGRGFFLFYFLFLFL